jgi:hypothetical protein
VVIDVGWTCRRVIGERVGGEVERCNEEIRSICMEVELCEPCEEPCRKGGMIGG